MRIKRILVPIDFSDTSLAALDAAAGFAKAFGAKLLLISAVEPVIVTADLAGAAEILVKAEQETAMAFQKRLVATARNLTKRGLECRSLVARGNAALTIVETARKTKADLIVIGTHGRTGFSHLFLGSVAERVVRTAPCLVLTVHGAGRDGSSGGKRSRR